MATHNQFLGFKRVLTGATRVDNYLYFERTDVNAVEGKIWFNDVCYGSCRDSEIDKILEALEGFIPASGEVTNIKEYIDEAVSAITSGMTTSVEADPNAFSGLTIEDRSSTPNVKDYVVNLQNVAPADELAAEIEAREDADEALQAELDAVENSLGFSDTAYTQDGTYITGGTVAADIAILDEVLASYRSGSTEEIDAIEEAVGLNPDGSYVDKSGTNYLDDATSVEGEIAALDEALKEVADRTVTESGSVENYVKLTVATESGNTTIAIDDSDLKDAIEAMDYSGVTPNGQAIVNVTEADGVITATQGDIAAEHVTIADAGNLFTATNVEDALAEIDAAYKAADEAIVGDATSSGDTLGKLEDRIEALDADAKEYHIVKITEGLPEVIKERYELQDADGNVSGDTVDIPKDSHIVSINYITTSGDPHYQNLEYVYIDASGNTQTVYVDMSQLVLETEFASGVSATGGVVHGVVDSQSEDFLTVGADGFKLSGVQDAIDDAKDEVMSALTETAATLTEMIEEAASVSTTEVVEGEDNEHLSISASTEADGHKKYTITLTDVASASALTQEISDREDADGALQAEVDAIERAVGLSTGGTYIADDGKYVSAATSVAEAVQMLNDALEVSESDWEEALADEIAARESGDTQLHDALTAETSAREEADEALDERLDAIEESYLTGVTVNDVEASVSANTASVTIDAGDIEIGTPLSAATGSSLEFDADAKVDEVLQGIIDSLSQAVAGSYTGVSSADGSVIVNPNQDGLGQNLAVRTKELALADVQAGETEVKKDESTGALYGVMYWIDEETA